MLLLTLAACAACCAVLWAAFVVLSSGRADHAPRSARVQARALPREEDAVRPAVDPSGARIWVEEDDLFWHEIVCWPARRPPESGSQRPGRTRRGA